MSNQPSIMERIADANKSVTAGIDSKDIKHLVTISIMGRKYKVPSELTIMQAMEYAGYKFIRSCGCRAGFCGSCDTVYRKEGEYKLHGVLACQTRVENGMYLVQIPFAPAEKALYDINDESMDAASLMKHYPELARCMACNTCTKACPQELEVMDYVQDAIRGDFQAITKGSFDCVQCGLCAIRCPAEIVQYHMAQLARRLYGRYGIPDEEELNKRVEEIENHKFDKELEEVIGLGRDKLEEIYIEQQKTRQVY